MAMTQTDKDIREIAHLLRDLVNAERSRNALLAKIATALESDTDTSKDKE